MNIMARFILLEFSATWCGPCKIQRPIIEDLKKLKDLFDINIIDVDDNTEMAEKYNITAVPTIIILDNHKEIFRYMGVTEKEKILSDIKKYN